MSPPDLCHLAPREAMIPSHERIDVLHAHLQSWGLLSPKRFRTIDYAEIFDHYHLDAHTHVLLHYLRTLRDEGDLSREVVWYNHALFPVDSFLHGLLRDLHSVPFREILDSSLDLVWPGRRLSDIEAHPDASPMVGGKDASLRPHLPTCLLRLLSEGLRDESRDNAQRVISGELTSCNDIWHQCYDHIHQCAPLRQDEVDHSSRMAECIEGNSYQATWPLWLLAHQENSDELSSVGSSYLTCVARLISDMLTCGGRRNREFGDNTDWQFVDFGDVPARVRWRGDWLSSRDFVASLLTQLDLQVQPDLHSDTQ